MCEEHGRSAASAAVSTPRPAAGRDSAQDLPLPTALVSDYQHHGVFAVLGARTFDDSGDHGRLLARAHPSGQWLEWLEP